MSPPSASPPGPSARRARRRRTTSSPCTRRRAGAEHALSGGFWPSTPAALVKDAAGDLLLHVALRAAAAPATVEALPSCSRSPPRSVAATGRRPRSSPRTTRRRRRKRRWRRWCAARAEVRRNAEKLRRSAAARHRARRARGGGGRARGDRAADRGARPPRGERRACPRARDDDESRDFDAANERESRRRARAADASCSRARRAKRPRGPAAGRRCGDASDARCAARCAARCSASPGRHRCRRRSRRRAGRRRLTSRRGWRRFCASVSARENLVREASALARRTPIRPAWKRVHPNPASVPAVSAARASKPEPSVPGTRRRPDGGSRRYRSRRRSRCFPRSRCASTRRREIVLTT